MEGPDRLRERACGCGEALLMAAPHPSGAFTPGPRRQSGRSSGVEHNLAKVGVEGSNPFARSSDSDGLCLDRCTTR